MPYSAETIFSLNTPPTRGSRTIESRSATKPLGPHQPARVWGSVHAFHTCERGASKTRLMTIRCSDMMGASLVSVIRRSFLREVQARWSGLRDVLVELVEELAPALGELGHAFLGH